MAYSVGGKQYTRRIKIKIDSSNIDETLTHFPVTLFITNPKIFTTVGGDSNRLKIAITKADKATELYGEIEQWDTTNNKAVIHISMLGWEISSSVDTIFYLYYGGGIDNTTYVGDTGDAPAQSVWDSNFKLVMHMAQDPNGDVADAIKDSTSNANHGTPAGSMTSADLVDGKVGKGIDFDGANDYITKASFLNAASLTVSCIVNITEADAWFVNKRDAVLDDQWQLFNYDGDLRCTVFDGSNTIGSVTDGTTVVDAGYVQVGFTTEGVSDGDLILYRQGVSNGTPTTLSADMKLGSSGLYIGVQGWVVGGLAKGIIDEVRISNTVRSASWMKATYKTLYDTLLTHGEPEHQRRVSQFIG